MSISPIMQIWYYLYFYLHYLFTWITYITYITYYVTHNILQYQKGSWEHPAQKAVLLFGHRGSFKRRSWTTEHGNDDVNLRCSRFSLWQLSSEGCICTNYSSRHCDYLMQTLSLHSSCDLWLEVACSIFWKRWMVGPLALQNLSRVSQVATSELDTCSWFKFSSCTTFKSWKWLFQVLSDGINNAACNQTNKKCSSTWRREIRQCVLIPPGKQSSPNRAKRLQFPAWTNWSKKMRFSVKP